MIDAAELALLRGSHQDHSRQVRLVVHACAYSCCGRGWQRRDGYEQEYHGWIDNLHEPAEALIAAHLAEKLEALSGIVTPSGLVYDEPAGSFMLYSAGIGTISYVIAARFDEVDIVEAV